MNPPQNFNKLQSRGVPANTVVAATYPCGLRDRVYIGVARGTEAGNRVVQWAMPTGTYIKSTTYSLQWAGCPGGQDSVDVTHMVPLWDAYVEDMHVYLKAPLRAMLTRMIKHGVPSPTRGHAYKKRNDTLKISTNTRLAQLAAVAAQKCLIDDPTPTGAMYLDSAEASTTRALKTHANYRDADLHTPNDDPHVCASIKAAFPHVNAPLSTIENFISKGDALLSYVWLDGMGTWSGNRAMKRSTRVAMRRLFTAKRLATHAVIAYTISLRGQPGNRADSARREMKRIHAEISPWAEKAGYSVNRATMIHMPRGMMTVAFNSFKNIDIPCTVE